MTDVLDASGRPFDDPASGPPAPVPVETLWTHARDLFQDGVPGADVCAALNLSPSTFWARAAREGWLRRDRPAEAPRSQHLDLGEPVDDLAGALDKAWRRVCGAIDAGRSADAVRWLRVHAQLQAVAATARQTAAPADAAPEAVAPAGPALEKRECVFADSSPVPLPDREPSLNRAQRRRLDRLRGGP